MSDVSGDGDVSATVTEHSAQLAASYPSLTVSASYKESGGGKSSSKRRPIRTNLDDVAADNEFITQLHGSDPVKVELNRLENEVRGSKKTLPRSTCVESFLIFFSFFLLLMCVCCMV